MAYCRSGNRAASAVSLLARAGYDVTLIDGLIDSWPGFEASRLNAGVA
jgi:rhodanese-related sulfurtransferase